MTDVGEVSLSLDEVARRFLDSEQALAQARERLETLTSATERTRSSQAALEESAAAVLSFMTAATELTEELRRLQVQARDTLEAAGELLGEHEQQRFRESVEERLAKLEAKVDQIHDAVHRRRSPWRSK